MKHPSRMFCFALFMASICCAPVFGQSPAKTGGGFDSLLGMFLKPVDSFPKRFPAQSLVTIPNPDLSVFISIQQINDLIAASLKAPLPLGHNTRDTRATLTAQSVMVQPDTRRSILQVYVKKGVMALDESFGGVDGTMKVNQAEFELAPRIVSDSRGNIIINTEVRCVFLDIENMATPVDQKLAHLLQDFYLSKNPFEPINLSDILKPSTLAEALPNVHITLTKASVIMYNKGIDIQTSWLVK